MATKKEKSPERTTKKEMLDTYSETNRTDEKAKSELKPEKVKEEKKDKEIVSEADAIASSDLDMKIDILKSDITNHCRTFPKKSEMRLKNTRSFRRPSKSGKKS